MSEVSTKSPNMILPETDDLNEVGSSDLEWGDDLVQSKPAVTEKKAEVVNDSILNWYLNEIHKIPMLSREDEYAVALRAMEGDQEARDALVRGNLRFVVTIAKRYQSYGLTLMDLINEGNLGLIKAAERFNPERGFHFISYAVWWIRQSIKYAIQQKASLIRLPLNRMADLKRIDEAIHWFENQEDGESSIENIADYMGMDATDVTHLIRMSKDHLSLDAPMADSEDFTLGDNIEDTKQDDAQCSLEYEQLRSELSKSLDQLTDRERKVIMLRFGLDGGPIYSLQRIGKMVGLSKERVRQIEKKALRKIRTGVNSRQLGAFLP